MTGGFFIMGRSPFFLQFLQARLDFLCKKFHPEKTGTVTFVMFSFPAEIQFGTCQGKGKIAPVAQFKFCNSATTQVA